jgi:hypothetical protein
VSHTVEFARRTGARRLALFHHDPLHDDAAVDAITEAARTLGDGSLERIDAAREGEALEISA